jgi:flagellar hook-basal body complex protein FliE
MDSAASLAAIGPLDDLPGMGPWPEPAAPSAPATGIEFARIFDREMSQVNGDISAAETAMRDYAEGKPVELHDLMIRLERARVSVQVFVQVRNKIVESYQDLMRMQA